MLRDATSVIDVRIVDVAASNVRDAPKKMAVLHATPLGGVIGVASTE